MDDMKLILEADMMFGEDLDNYKTVNENFFKKIYHKFADWMADITEKDLLSNVLEPKIIEKTDLIALRDTIKNEIDALKTLRRVSLYRRGLNIGIKQMSAFCSTHGDKHPELKKKANQHGAWLKSKAMSMLNTKEKELKKSGVTESVEMIDFEADMGFFID